MVKELRTTTAGLRAVRLGQLTPEEEAHWGMTQTQTFTPPLEVLFKTEEAASPSTFGLRFSDPLQKVLSPTTIRTESGKTVTVHRKTTSILSPFRWMRGDYSSLGLPTTTAAAKEISSKMQSPHTAAYVGALASSVLSESGCPHFPKVYGVYCGIARQHSVDISDDYEILSERPWFAANMGKTFQLRLKPTIGSPTFEHTRGQRPSIKLGDDAMLEDVQELGEDGRVISVASLTLEETPMLVESGVEVSDDEDDSESTTSTAQVYEIRSCACSDDDASSMDIDEDDDDDAFAWAELANAPVVTTVMEACEGTLYDLVEADADPSHHAAYFAQVVLALAYAQRNFAFTHNDLHGNNVMFVPTTATHLYYNLAGTVLRVPTYGRLIKIIDFDRAILSVRVQGMREAKTFMSDQFHEDEEAGGQYNVEPFYNPKHPEIKPNPSFDLARLATSIFWELFPEGPDAPSDHPLKPLFIRWMTQADGTSVLYRADHANHDRYHGFHQYKAIARYCKDSAVPRKETALLAFKVDKVPLGEPCILIEA